MGRQFATRSQRRLEKKQAVILLTLVLVVSVVSFALGVLVGRGGARKTVVATPPQTVRLPVAEDLPAATAPAQAQTTGERPTDSLTFYDSLPKGGQAPLGSGINLPPAKAPAPESTKAPNPAAEKQEKPAQEGSPAAAPAVPVKGNAPAPSTPPKSVATATKRPEPSSAGGFLVQAAAFRGSEDARGLQANLARKGFTSFVEEVDLGPKGKWYRVYVGPFTTAVAADGAVARLKTEEKLTAIVRKR